MRRRTCSLLSLVATAAAALVMAAPAAGAVVDGVYYIRDGRTLDCVVPDAGAGARLERCSKRAQWILTGQADGTVRFALAADPDRCLAQAPFAASPPIVWLDRCGGGSPDRWRIDGPDGLPSTLTPAGSTAGSLTSTVSTVTLGGDGSREWVVQRVG